MGKSNGLGYTRVTIPDKKDCTNKTAVIKVGGKKIEDCLADLEAAFKKSQDKMVVDDIEALTEEQCDTLRCGDVVIERTRSADTCYHVSHTSIIALSLVNYTAEFVTQVNYDNSEDGWTHSGTTVTELALEK